MRASACLALALAISAGPDSIDRSPTSTDLSGQCIRVSQRLVVRNVSGVVIDSRGQPLPNARVAVYSGKDRRLVREVQAGENGEFSFKNLPAGHYEVESHLEGLRFPGLTAQRPVEVATWPRGGFLVSRSLEVLIDLFFGGLHQCSDVEYRRQPD